MTNGVSPQYAGPPPPAKKPMPMFIKIIIGAAIAFGCGVPFLGIGAAIVIPGMLRARMAGNEASAIGTMRVISSAQMTFSLSCGHGLFARSLPVLGKPSLEGGSSGTGFLSADLARGEWVEHSGYRVWLEAPPAPAGAEKPCNGAGAEDVATTFVAKAEPIRASNGRRYFATSANGIVYQSDESITFGEGGAANPPAVPVQ